MVSRYYTSTSLIRGWRQAKVRTKNSMMERAWSEQIEDRRRVIKREDIWRRQLRKETKSAAMLLGKSIGQKVARYRTAQDWRSKNTEASMIMNRNGGDRHEEFVCDFHNGNVEGEKVKDWAVSKHERVPFPSLFKQFSIQEHIWLYKTLRRVGISQDGQTGPPGT